MTNRYAPNDDSEGFVLRFEGGEQGGDTGEEADVVGGVIAVIAAEVSQQRGEGGLSGKDAALGTVGKGAVEVEEDDAVGHGIGRVTGRRAGRRFCRFCGKGGGRQAKCGRGRGGKRRPVRPAACRYRRAQ